MLLRRSKSLAYPALAACAISACAMTQSAKQPKSTDSHPKKSAVTTSTVPAAKRAPRPSELPASPPKVVYGDRELSIVAVNSTLADVLLAVQQATHSKIDVPASASRERVFVRIGPASPRAVVAALLEGSNYDYMIVGDESVPGAVQRVILKPRPIATAAMTGGTAPPPQPIPTNPAPEANEPVTIEAAPEEQNNNPDDGEQENPQPEPPAQAEPQPQQNNGVKTPEQLLEELRQMQQQQQQQQNQNPNNEN